jgi:hypothetical protein
MVSRPVYAKCRNGSGISSAVSAAAFQEALSSMELLIL